MRLCWPKEHRKGLWRLSLFNHVFTQAGDGWVMNESQKRDNVISRHITHSFCPSLSHTGCRLFNHLCRRCLSRNFGALNMRSLSNLMKGVMYRKMEEVKGRCCLVYRVCCACVSISCQVALYSLSLCPSQTKCLMKVLNIKLYHDSSCQHISEGYLLMIDVLLDLVEWKEREKERNEWFSTGCWWGKRVNLSGTLDFEGR